MVSHDHGICVPARSCSSPECRSSGGSPGSWPRTASPSQPGSRQPQPWASGTSVGMRMCWGQARMSACGWGIAGAWHSYRAGVGLAGTVTDGCRMGRNGAPRPTGVVGRATDILLQSKSRAVTQLVQKIPAGFEENTDVWGKGSCHKGWARRSQHPFVLQ